MVNLSCHGDPVAFFIVLWILISFFAFSGRLTCLKKVNMFKGVDIIAVISHRPGAGYLWVSTAIGGTHPSLAPSVAITTRLCLPFLCTMLLTGYSAPTPTPSSRQGQNLLTNMLMRPTPCHALTRNCRLQMKAVISLLTPSTRQLNQ